MIEISPTVRVDVGPRITESVCTQADYNRAPPDNRVDARGNALVVGEQMARLANANGDKRWKVYQLVDGKWAFVKEFASEAEACDYAEVQLA
jgi:hypothetical protein